MNSVQLSMQSTSLHSSGLSQMVIFKLLDYYGVDGFSAHMRNVSAYYRQQRDLMQAHLARHLKGLCEWDVPISGMFFWLRMRDELGIRDTGELITSKAAKAKVLMLPGKVFYPLSDPRSQQCPFVRASFSKATEQEMEVGLGRFAKLVRGEVEEGGGR